MPPGLPASRCVVCLVTAIGVALGPTAWAGEGGGSLSSAPPALLAPAKPSGSPATGTPRSPTAGSSAKERPLAGRSAGEGRARPGRSLSPLGAANSEAAADEVPPDPDPAEVPAFTPPPEAFPEPGRSARLRQAQDGSATRQVRDVSLGSGIALVGLGLAFLGLRMRRAD
ncbi:MULTISPECIES: hypothetical protein [unclassified Streptomyces]|uniref:hypothetical protein n=1 Tax=unclassified Streptomyces TaxID=2593676 RepID=UPI002E0F2874|nr:hypothetical protein OG265_17715 [Streptomyces sp. NBC_01208]